MKTTKSKIVSVGKVAITVFFWVTVNSCGNSKKDELTTPNFELIDAGSDTVFSIPNRRLHDAATISLEGTLSDTSVISFSTDTLLQKTTFFVPEVKTTFSKTLDLTSIKNDTLFIKYHPTKKSIRGDIKISVKFL